MHTLIDFVHCAWVREFEKASFIGDFLLVCVGARALLVVFVGAHSARQGDERDA